MVTDSTAPASFALSQRHITLALRGNLARFAGRALLGDRPAAVGGRSVVGCQPAHQVGLAAIPSGRSQALLPAQHLQIVEPLLVVRQVVGLAVGVLLRRRQPSSSAVVFVYRLHESCMVLAPAPLSATMSI